MGSGPVPTLVRAVSWRIVWWVRRWGGARILWSQRAKGNGFERRSVLSMGLSRGPIDSSEFQSYNDPSPESTSTLLLQGPLTRRRRSSASARIPFSNLCSPASNGVRYHSKTCIPTLLLVHPLSRILSSVKGMHPLRAIFSSVFQVFAFQGRKIRVSRDEY